MTTGRVVSSISIHMDIVVSLRGHLARSCWYLWLFTCDAGLRQNTPSCFIVYCSARIYYDLLPCDDGIDAFFCRIVWLDDTEPWQMYCSIPRLQGRYDRHVQSRAAETSMLE
jgi:hypothetical protein